MRGRRGYIYRRGQDWIVGYDTGSDEARTEEGHSPLHYISPGLLQLGGGDHHGGEERGLLPGARQGELEAGSTRLKFQIYKLIRANF